MGDQMKTIEVQYTDDELDIVLHLKEATGYDGIRFSTMQGQASSSLEKADDEDRVARFTVCVWTWPACMASTVKVEGSEKINGHMTLEDFLALPWNLIRAWESGSVEANPTFSPFWRPRRKNENEAETG